MPIESRRPERAVLDPDGEPVCLAAGTRAGGEYHCPGCGYGITVTRMLPECPMCRGREWEEAATSPYGLSRR